MDALSTRLLALVMDPNTTMDQMLSGMESLSTALNAENKAAVASATPADSRKLAQANLARKYRK